MSQESSANNLSTCATSSPMDSKESNSSENIKVRFKVIYNKTHLDIEFPVEEQITTLKQHIQTLTSVAPTMQKLVLKGRAITNDDKTLKDVGIGDGVKLLLVGSTINEVIAINVPSSVVTKEEKPVVTKERLCQQRQHKKIIDKGVPEFAMHGIRGLKAPLPLEPLHGMVNKYGSKVRLTFKLELDQLWIGTNERTEKFQMVSIRSVVSEPIDGHEDYHIIGVQVGPTEASRYWIYWVPAQYVDAIKDTILKP